MKIDDYRLEVFRDELIQSSYEYPYGIYSLSEKISDFRFYLETLEKFIVSRKRSGIEQLEKQAQNLPKAQRSKFWDQYYLVHWDEIFGNRIRSSFLISLVSFAETGLNQICRDTAVIVRSEIKSNDLRGSIFERSKKFLGSFGKFTKPSEPEWKLITQIYDIRNVLVHNNGSIFSPQHKKQSRQLSQFVNGQSGLSQTHDFIEIEKEFCLFCLEKIESFLQRLREEVKDLCERVKHFEPK